MVRLLQISSRTSLPLRLTLRNIRLVMIYSGSESSFRALPCRQIIMNLVTNAAEPIGDYHDRVTIGQTLDATSVKKLPEGNYLALEIFETGC